MSAIVVLVPGMGDDVQALKAGVMEIADIFVVNKSDREGADRTVAEIESLLSLHAYQDGEWRPPIVRTQATDRRRARRADRRPSSASASTHGASTRGGAQRAAAQLRVDSGRAADAAGRIARVAPAEMDDAGRSRSPRGRIDPYTLRRADEVLGREGPRQA